MTIISEKGATVLQIVITHPLLWNVLTKVVAHSKTCSMIGTSFLFKATVGQELVNRSMLLGAGGVIATFRSDNNYTAH